MRRLMLALSLLVLVACEERVTLDNYEKIEKGMTRNQVIGILGKGKDATATGFGVGSTGISTNDADKRTFIWESGDGAQIICVFENNALVSKRKVDLD